MNGDEIYTEVKDALDRSVPGVVTAFVGYIQYVDADGDMSWAVLADPDSDLHTLFSCSHNMYRYFDLRMNHSLADALGYLDE